MLPRNTFPSSDLTFSIGHRDHSVSFSLPYPTIYFLTIIVPDHLVTQGTGWVGVFYLLSGAGHPGRRHMGLLLLLSARLLFLSLVYFNPPWGSDLNFCIYKISGNQRCCEEHYTNILYGPMYHIKDIIFDSENETKNCHYKKTEMGSVVHMQDTFLGKMDSETNVHEKFTFQDLI